MQKDGKIVAAGEADFTFFDGDTNRTQRLAALVRYNVDGSLDDGSAADVTPGDRFGANGKVILHVPGSETAGRIFAAAITADGKIVVGGSDDQLNPANPGGSETAAFVARLNASGTPDASFGNGGFAVATFGSTLVAEIRGLAVLGDGRVIAVGSSDRRWAVARFTAGGAPDRTFSGDGYDALYWSGSNDVAKGVAIDDLGDAVVAGNAASNIGIARNRPDGSLDPNFSADGKATYFDYPGPVSNANSVAVSAGGLIVVVGDSKVARPGFDPIVEPAVFRFTARGDRYVGNSTFEPTLVLDMPGFNATVTLQANDVEVVGGSLQNGSDTRAKVYTAVPSRQLDFSSYASPNGRDVIQGHDAGRLAAREAGVGLFRRDSAITPDHSRSVRHAVRRPGRHHRRGRHQPEQQQVRRPVRRLLDRAQRR